MAEPLGCKVWFADLGLLAGEHESLLDATERIRANGYARAEDRSRFVLAAALLKHAVAEATGVSADDVIVDRTCDQCGQQHGRPRIPATGLEVSVAHSGSLVAVALTRLGPVGVDVEQQIEEPDMALVARVIAPGERAPDRHFTMREFLTYWCRKESVLKATGEGLRVPLTEVVVSEPADPPSLRSYRGNTLDAALVDLDLAGAGYPSPGYVAALTVLTSGPVSVAVEDAARLLRPEPRSPGNAGKVTR